MLAELRDAIAKHDCKAVARGAHAFKGMVSNFCSEPAALLARELEVMGKQENLAGAEVHLDALTLQSERLKDALNEMLSES